MALLIAEEHDGMANVGWLAHPAYWVPIHAGILELRAGGIDPARGNRIYVCSSGKGDGHRVGQGGDDRYPPRPEPAYSGKVCRREC